jgi:hypothetical protein
MLTFKRGRIKILDFGGAPFLEPPVTQACPETIDWVMKMTKKWPVNPERRRPGNCPGIVAKPDVEKPWGIQRIDPNCVCDKGLLLYVPPGQTVYPCPVHPERGIRGQEIRC